MYRNDVLVIDRDVTILGAAPGNVTDHVIIERDNDSTVVFTEGASRAYIGYVTIKVSAFPFRCKAIRHCSSGESLVRHFCDNRVQSFSFF